MRFNTIVSFFCASAVTIFACKERGIVAQALAADTSDRVLDLPQKFSIYGVEAGKRLMSTKIESTTTGQSFFSFDDSQEITATSRFATSLSIVCNKTAPSCFVQIKEEGVRDAFGTSFHPNHESKGFQIFIRRMYKEYDGIVTSEWRETKDSSGNKLVVFGPKDGSASPFTIACKNHGPIVQKFMPADCEIQLAPSTATME